MKKHHSHSKPKSNINSVEMPSRMYSGFDSIKKQKEPTKVLITKKDINPSLSFSSFFNTENEFKYLDSLIPFELFENPINRISKNVNNTENNEVCKKEINNSEILQDKQEDITEYIENFHKDSKNPEIDHNNIKTLKANKFSEISSEHEFRDISIKKEIKIYTKRKLPLYFYQDF